MQPITKDYIRGFFDGEGCLTFYKKRYPNNKLMPTYYLSISNYNTDLLKLVSNKLSLLGIRNNITMNSKNGKDWKIFITHPYFIYKFYKIIGTAHMKKEERFQEFLKSSGLKKYLKIQQQKNQIKKLKKMGYKTKEIAQKLNCPYNAIWFLSTNFYYSYL